MQVTTLILNKEGMPHFQSQDQFDIDHVFKLAKAREDVAKENGAEWSAGAVSHFGKEVVKAVNTGENPDVTKAIIQMLLAAWLFDSVFGGITTNQYLASDMKFTITDDGVVMHTRSDKSS